MDKKILPIIKAALKEDIGPGDITTELTIPAKQRIKAVILAKESGIICGLNVAGLTFKAVDRGIRFHAAVREGRNIKKETVIARLEGNAAGILKAERTALNFLSRLSGIATLTGKFVKRVKPYRVRIMDTRKTTPGLRTLEKYAVRCGGGFNHRMGLWDQVLIKDNHLCAVNCSLLAYSKKSLKKTIERIKQRKPKNVKIEIEVKNLRQFEQALEASLDIIMLDNFSIKNIKKAVKIKKRLPFPIRHLLKLEASGGVNLNNVRRIAACGVEMISVGELTHSAPALDAALNCE